MWTGDSEAEADSEGATEVRSARVIAMRDGTRNENETR